MSPVQESLPNVCVDSQLQKQFRTAHPETNPRNQRQSTRKKMKMKEKDARLKNELTCIFGRLTLLLCNYAVPTAEFIAQNMCRILSLLSVMFHTDDTEVGGAEADSVDSVSEVFISNLG